MGEPRKVDTQRWRQEITTYLSDFPRQFKALEYAMSVFGDDFDFQEFKAAYESADDMEAYNRAQALERAVSRVQNYVGDLAIAGVKLAGLETTAADGGPAQRAFVNLKAAGVIDGSLARKLKKAQEGRKDIEHAYGSLPAGEVHRAALQVHESSLDFIRSYRDWIEEFR
ncbi:MAG: hypothetical protein JJE13_06120 [Thermoleophilia bacterium]|nr:hypothetical protein [Thermoleophilia bacterium]